MKRLSSKAKAKFGVVASAVVFGASAIQAEVLTAEQKTALTNSLSAGYSEYIGLLVTVVAVVIPVVLIGRFLWGRLGKGGNA